MNQDKRDDRMLAPYAIGVVIICALSYFFKQQFLDVFHLFFKDYGFVIPAYSYVVVIAVTMLISLIIYLLIHNFRKEQNRKLYIFMVDYLSIYIMGFILVFSYIFYIFLSSSGNSEYFWSFYNRMEPIFLFSIAIAIAMLQALGIAFGAVVIRYIKNIRIVMYITIALIFISFGLYAFERDLREGRFEGNITEKGQTIFKEYPVYDRIDTKYYLHKGILYYLTYDSKKAMTTDMSNKIYSWEVNKKSKLIYTGSSSSITKFDDNSIYLKDLNKSGLTTVRMGDVEYYKFNLDGSNKVIDTNKTSVYPIKYYYGDNKYLEADKYIRTYDMTTKKYGSICDYEIEDGANLSLLYMKDNSLYFADDESGLVYCEVSTNTVKNLIKGYNFEAGSMMFEYDNLLYFNITFGKIYGIDKNTNELIKTIDYTKLDNEDIANFGYKVVGQSKFNNKLYFIISYYDSYKTFGYSYGEKILVYNLDNGKYMLSKDYIASYVINNGMMYYSKDGILLTKKLDELKYEEVK